MKTQLIDFKENEYQTALMYANRRLKAWNKVKAELEKLIELPNTKKQYDAMLDNPLQYAKQTLDDKHRPQFNGLPISTDKLLEMLDIDLAPLENSIKEMNVNEGKLTFTVGGGVSIVLNKEDFEVYTDNDAQLEQFNALQKFIDAARAIFDNGLPSHSTYHLERFSNNRIKMHNGDLRPCPYHLQQIK
jgi:hypothetical protein